MYIAMKYIGRKYTPGEVLPNDLPKETIAWLLEAGAIRKEASAPAVAIVEEVEEAETEAAAEVEADVEDEIDEDAEAPEIDIMDGVVSAEEPKKSTRTMRKTKGGK